ncbi:hypothetical protein SEA_EVAA_68 [Gordonia phage Evaa]|nr:hypothetical protein SEA_EVAA_68 [Gordonia phage Evaa]
MGFLASSAPDPTTHAFEEGKGLGCAYFETWEMRNAAGQVCMVEVEHCDAPREAHLG